MTVLCILLIAEFHLDNRVLLLLCLVCLLSPCFCCVYCCCCQQYALGPFEIRSSLDDVLLCYTDFIVAADGAAVDVVVAAEGLVVTDGADVAFVVVAVVAADNAA